MKFIINKEIELADSICADSKRGAIPNLLPKGDSFLQLRLSDSILIDKTLLIPLIEDNSNQVAIIHPPKWGKTINLSMLNEFYKARFDSHGKFDSSHFNNTMALFRGGLYVSDTNDGKQYSLSQTKLADEDYSLLFEYYMGRYFVIHLNFSDCKTTSSDSQFAFDSYINAYKNALHVFYKQNEAVLNIIRERIINEIQEADSEPFRYTIEKSLNLLNKLSNDQLTAADVNGRYLNDLVSLIFNYTGRQVVLLVDEYDKPLRNLIDTYDLSTSHDSIRKTEIEKATAFFHNFYIRVTTGNDYVHKVVFTGTSTILVSPASELGHFGIYDFNRHMFDSEMGFNEKDVKHMLYASCISYQDSKHIYKNLVDWYGGYEEQVYQNQEFIEKRFNPFAVVSYLSQLIDDRTVQPKPFWTTSHHDKLFDVILNSITDKNIGKIILELINGEAIISTSMAYNPLLNVIILDKWGIGESELFTAARDYGFIVSSRFSDYYYKFPNEDVRSYASTKIYKIAKSMQDPQECMKNLQMQGHKNAEEICSDTSYFDSFIEAISNYYRYKEAVVNINHESLVELVNNNYYETKCTQPNTLERNLAHALVMSGLEEELGVVINNPKCTHYITEPDNYGMLPADYAILLGFNSIYEMIHSVHSNSSSETVKYGNISVEVAKGESQILGDFNSPLEYLAYLSNNTNSYVKLVKANSPAGAGESACINGTSKIGEIALDGLVRGQHWDGDDEVLSLMTQHYTDAAENLLILCAAGENLITQEI